MIRVGVIAPTAALRAGLRALLAADEGLQVTAEGQTLADLESPLSGLDVILWAAPPKDAPGEALLAVKDEGPVPGLLFLMDEAEDLPEPPSAGLWTWGALLLEATSEELAAAVMALHQGLAVGAPHLLKRWLGETSQEADDPRPGLDGGESLTARESQVLELLAQGLANKQIALELGISEHTVKFHISSVYGKLGAANRTEAVRLGVRKGLVLL